MTPWSELPGPGPGPPAGLPDVEIPTPNYQAIGEAVATGAAKAGMWAQIADVLRQGVKDILREALIWMTAQAANLSNAIARAMMEAESKGGPDVDRLAEVAIEDLFGVQVRIRAAGAAARGQRQRAASSIGAAVLQGLVGTFEGGGAGQQLQPGSERAKKYLDTVVGLGLEGWLAGFTAELFSLGALETFGELDDILAQTLGLSRASSQVISPAIDVLVRTPWEWDLNRRYRPRLLTAGQCVRAWRRGRMTRDRVREELARQGWSDDRIETLLVEQSRHLTDTDIDYLVARGAWSREQAVQALRDQGWSAEQAAALLAIAEDRRLDGFRRTRAGVAGDAFSRGEIPQEQYLAIMDRIAIPEREKREMHLTAGLRREMRSRDISMSDYEAMVKRGIKTLTEYRRYLLDLGYSLDEAQSLELLLMAEVTDAASAARARQAQAKRVEEERRAREAAAKAKREEAARRAAVRGLSLAQVERLVRAGVRSMEEYRTFLSEMKFGAADADDLVGLMVAELDQAAAQARRRAEIQAAAEERDLNLSQVERAVRAGVLTTGDYAQWLIDNGFAADEMAVLSAVMEADLAARRDAERGREEARRRLEQREISLADVETAVRRGILTVEQYAAVLEREGFGGDDLAVMVELMRVQLADDVAARTEREAAAQRLRERRVSLDDLERAVRAGIRTMSDYRAELARAGMALDAQDTLVALLQLVVDQDAAAARARAEAARRLAERRVSIGDLERGVKLGIVPIAQYGARLAEVGFRSEDTAVLVAMLTADLAAMAADRRRRDEVARRLATRQISLDDLERAVRAGVRSTVDYRGALAAEGFEQRDVDTLVALLDMQVAQDAAGRQARVEAARRLAERRVSLDDLERAVKLGIVPLARYGARLAEVGFPAEDTAVLVALLRAEIEAVEAVRRERAEAAARLRARRISLDELEIAVRQGVRTEGDYRAALVAEGFASADVETLVRLLALRMEQDAAARAERQRIDGELTLRGLSLARAEQAVMEDVWTLDRYVEWLQEEEYAPEAAWVLAELLSLRLASRE